jgi:hypothetical protein
MSNQVTKALSGEQARNHAGGFEVAPEVARHHEIDEADRNLENWHITYDPTPIAATAMSTQVESEPHATTTVGTDQSLVNQRFNQIMAASAQDGLFDAGYINAISGEQLGADMPVDTPRPAPVEAQQNFQQYQGV